MKKTGKYRNTSLKKLAAKLSGENIGETGGKDNLSAADDLIIEKYWMELGKMNNSKEINVDKAWNNVITRIEENGLLAGPSPEVRTISRGLIFRIAAIGVVLVGLGALLLSIFISDNTGNNVNVASGSDQKNIQIDLPDGSRVWLNRNTELSYYGDQEAETRNVKLTGEAFFEISPDPGRPFVINAGDGTITVVGTSFNVISNNSSNEVEVYVKTGKVRLSDTNGGKGIMLEPEYIGTIDNGNPVIRKNENANYLSWKTNLLVYNSERLEVVFSDLKKVYNIDVITDNPEILNKTITATYDREPQDTIIDLICTTFTLSYSKEGPIYRLSKR